MRKQGKAFQGIDKKGKERSVVNISDDRQKCKTNYIEYISRCNEGKSVAKGKRVSIIDFIRDAVSAVDPIERDSLNNQWNDNAKQNGSLQDCIAMVDTSGSMECENTTPLYSAIGLGLRIAEKSRLGKRIMTFNSSPTWVRLDDTPDLVSMVERVKRAPWGMNTNFRAALDMILDAAITNKITPGEMSNMSLIILSDMQIDMAGYEERHSSTPDKMNTMFEMMKQKYAEAGMRSVYNKPYTLPHIVFWNLRITSGFPSLANTENTSMMSGNSPVLLNAFCEKGVASLKDITPWKFLQEELFKPRYDHLGTIVNNIWTDY